MTKQKLNHVSVELEFNNFKTIENTGFARGVCRVAYAGKNRNYSDISKDAFEKAEKTVYGIPVVGNWLGDNFGGHDIIIETKGNEISFKDSTIPFGFVPQDANPRWESVEDENGNTKNYYTVDVVLWHERYHDQVQFIIDNGARQSMEIMVTDGDWDDNWDYFNINDFYYSALCLLGKDEVNSSKDVEPCFEESDVTVGQFSMSDKFKKDVFAIRSAFEGGENMAEKDTKAEVVEVEMTEEVEEVADVELDVVETEVEMTQDVEVEEIKSYEIEFKEMTNKYNLLSDEYDAQKVEFDNLIIERDELQEYKNSKESEIIEAQKNELIEDYSLLLSEDEIQIAISNRDEMSYADVELELSKAFAKKSLEQAKSKNVSKKDNTVVFEVKSTETTKEKSKFAI